MYKIFQIKNGFIEEESCEITQLDQTNEFHLDEMNANTTYYIELIAQNTVGNSTTARITVTIPGKVKLLFIHSLITSHIRSLM